MHGQSQSHSRAPAAATRCGVTRLDIRAYASLAYAVLSKVVSLCGSETINTYVTTAPLISLPLIKTQLYREFENPGST